MNVSKQELIIKLSEQLKPLLKKPEWADFVKTGVHKEKPPVNSDWWYIRAASMLLKIKTLGPVGVSKLRTKYGGRKNMGVAPERFKKGSGSIIRKLLQQMETVGLLKKTGDKEKHKGRELTPKAESMIAQAIKSLDKTPKADKKSASAKKEQ